MVLVDHHWREHMAEYTNVARTYPLVPGCELTGVVVESTDARFGPGQTVWASDFGSTQGIARHGGYSEYARVPGDIL